MVNSTWDGQCSRFHGLVWFVFLGVKTGLVGLKQMMGTVPNFSVWFGLVFRSLKTGSFWFLEPEPAIFGSRTSSILEPTSFLKPVIFKTVLELTLVPGTRMASSGSKNQNELVLKLLKTEPNCEVGNQAHHLF